MKILIIDENVDEFFFSEMSEDVSIFDLVVDIRVGEYCYQGVSFKFCNLVELLKSFESYTLDFEQITLFSGILNYSSEINIRMIFSGFSNLVSSRFVYVDNKKLFNRKSSVLNRCLSAISKNPDIVVGQHTVMLTFEKGVKNWNDYSIKVMSDYTDENRIKKKDFILKIKEAIEEKKPFSFIRLNHCENRLIGQGVSFSKDEADITYKRQFGYLLDENDTDYISYRMKLAVKNSDILGVPDKKKNSSDKLHLLENSTFFHFSYFSLISKQKFINVNMHYYLGESQDFKDILNKSKDIVVITCRNMELLEKSIQRKIKIIKIPAQSHFIEKNGVEGKHFPDYFLDIEKQINTIVSPGTLVLVGAGVLGKIYCDTVKSAGGVSLDVGSLMDAIGNKVTRSGGFTRFSFWWNE